MLKCHYFPVLPNAFLRNVVLTLIFTVSVMKWKILCAKPVVHTYFIYSNTEGLLKPASYQAHCSTNTKHLNKQNS